MPLPNDVLKIFVLITFGAAAFSAIFPNSIPLFRLRYFAYLILFTKGLIVL